MDIAIALTSLARSMEVLNAMRNIDKNFDAATQKAEIANLLGSLADAKIALVDARDEMSSLNREIASLKDKLTFKDQKTVRNGQFVYEILQDGKTSYLPFCPKCIADAKFFPMSQRNLHDAVCPNCQVALNSRSIAFGRTATAASPRTAVAGEADG